MQNTAEGLRRPQRLWLFLTFKISKPRNDRKTNDTPAFEDYLGYLIEHLAAIYQYTVFSQFKKNLQNCTILKCQKS